MGKTPIRVQAGQGMAEFEMDRGRGAATGGYGHRWGGFGRLISLAGALVSLALVLGLASWGYKLAMRQMHGIPVILAPEGPSRVAPDNPGGELAQHQGLAVNEIAAVGEAAGAAERLALAPPPAALSPDDGISDTLQASLGTALGAPDGTTTAPDRGVRPSETMAALTPRSDRLAEPLPDGSVDAIDGADPAAEAAGPTISAEDIISADIPGVSSSPFPQTRPEVDVIAEAAALAVAEAMAPETAIDVDPHALAPGAQLAQIGSYETVAQAKLEWDKAAVRFAAVMDGKRRVIEAAESGGKAFYRLRVAGFESRDEVRRFCAAMKSGGQCVWAEVQ
jgi:hypothetical protein